VKKCPFCAEDIQDAAVFCRYCRRDLPAVQPSAADSEYRRDLDLRANASESTLVHTPDDTVAERHRIGSLQALLGDAESGGSVRDVISAFAEALAVWGSLDVRAYVAGPHGRYYQYVSLVGADPAATAAELDSAALPAGTSIVRLSRAEAERMGLASKAKNVLIRRILPETGAAGWLMVFSGTITAHDETRLTLYSELLRKSLNDLTVATTTRVRTAIARHLSRFSGPIEGAAQLALDEVITAVGAERGAFVVAPGSGMQALAVGDMDALPAFDHRVPPDRLLVTAQAAEDGGVMALAVAREGRGFSAHERGILAAAAAALQPWARRVVQRSAQNERRRTLQPFYELIERLSAQTVQDGGRASLILISIGHMVFGPGLMRAWVTRIRAGLRPSDVAGALAGNEIAVLLHDASAEQAAAVSIRLKKILESNGSPGECLEVSIGIGSAGSPLDGSVVRAARDDAARRARA
jgi:hypothetical protein